MLVISGKIFIAIPTLDHTVTAAISSLTFALAKAFPSRIDYNLECGVRTIGGARNRLVKKFLASDSEILWFIDADTVPSVSTGDLLKAVGEQYDVWGGVYPVLGVTGDRGLGWIGRVSRLTWTAYKKVETGFVPVEPEGDKALRVDALGTGCMMIRRHVLEDPKVPFGPPDQHGYPCIFKTTYTQSDQVDWSDDLVFCDRIAAAGYKVWCIPTVKWGHRKMMDLTDVYAMGVQAFEAGRNTT